MSVQREVTLDEFLESNLPDCHLARRQLQELREERDALAAHVERLNEYAKACANELVALIDKHNVQSDSDGSWLYDHQTPYELMQVVLSTPETSLARLKARWQAEALEELLQNTSQFREANPVRGLAGGMADELRRQAEGGE